MPCSKLVHTNSPGVGTEPGSRTVLIRLKLTTQSPPPLGLNSPVLARLRTQERPRLRSDLKPPQEGVESPWGRTQVQAPPPIHAQSEAPQRAVPQAAERRSHARVMHPGFPLVQSRVFWFPGAVQVDDEPAVRRMNSAPTFARTGGSSRAVRLVSVSGVQFPSPLTCCVGPGHSRALWSFGSTR